MCGPSSPRTPSPISTAPRSTGARKVAEGWSLLAYALARYPDKLCGHEVLCVGILVADSDKELERSKTAPFDEVTERLREVIAQGTWLFSAAVLPHLA